MATGCKKHRDVWQKLELADSISISDAMGYIIDQKDKRLFTLHHDRDEVEIYCWD